MEALNGKETWWGLVTGPREVVGDVLDHLSRGYSVVLITREDLPWRGEFWRRVADGLASRHPTMGIALREVNADALHGDDEPIDYLLSHFALEDDAIGFRVGMDPYQYLIDRRVISGMVLHVHGEDASRMRQWAEFCARWPVGSSQTGLFLLEMREEVYGNSLGSLRSVNYVERASGYSVQLFNGLCLEHGVSAELSEGRRRYLTSAITHLCENDVELSERLATRLNRPPFDPICAYAEVGGVMQGDELRRRLWEAQVETVFSVVQRRHMSIVDALRPQLHEALSKNHIMKNRERLCDPDDTDPGTLVYLLSARDDTGSCLLSAPDESLRDEIYLLRDCRNALAHRSCCTEEQIKRLLD